MMYDMQPPRATPLREPPAPRAPKGQKKSPKKTGIKCPSGFYFDKKKGRCVQAGVGPEFKP
jgi:hypothetical protein|tara:strand:- start:777 stop:959 length:183 start_codon:yes stop_codon:yes gene_type:complete